MSTVDDQPLEPVRSIEFLAARPATCWEATGATRSYSTYYALFLSLALMLGGSYPMTNVGLRGFDPLSLVLVRLAIGALFLGVWMAFRSQPFPRDRRMLRLLAAIGVLNAAGSFLLVTWGQKYVTASYTAILVGSNPIFVSVGAAFVLPDEYLTPRRMLGILVGFGGVVCLFSNELGLGGVSGGVHAILGALAILGGAIALAIVAITVRVRLSALSPAQVALPMLLSGLVAVSAAIVPLRLTGAVPVKFEPYKLGSLAAMVTLGVLNAGIGNLVYYTLIRKWGVTRTALVGYVVPLVGVALGVLLLHDRIGLNMVAGLVLITLSLLYANPLRSRRVSAV